MQAHGHGMEALSVGVDLRSGALTKVVRVDTMQQESSTLRPTAGAASRTPALMRASKSDRNLIALTVTCASHTRHLRKDAAVEGYSSAFDVV